MLQTFERLRPVAETLACKICGQTSALYGVVDFNKNCEEQSGVFLPVCGTPVYYHRCTACGLIFTGIFDDWPRSLFSKYIYNDSYLQVDPEYAGARATSTARIVAQFLAKAPQPRVLDYGGGNGGLASLLRAQSINAESWDTMVDATPPPLAIYDVVTAFEVFEHTPTPVETAAQALSCLNPAGVLLFSTVTAETLPPGGVTYWYIAPRNGHVTIYTKPALVRLFSRFGFGVHSYGPGLHLAARMPPPTWLP